MWAGKPSEGGIGTAHFNYDTFFVLAIELEPCGCAVSRNNGSLSIGSQDPNYRERLSRGGLYVDDPFFVVGRTAVVYKDMVTGVHRFPGNISDIGVSLRRSYVIIGSIGKYVEKETHKQRQ